MTRLLTKENNEVEFSNLSRDEILRYGGHNMRVTHYRNCDMGRMMLRTSLKNSKLAEGYYSALKHDGYTES